MLSSPESRTNFTDKFNLTWNVKSIENDTMHINISFYNPNWISTQTHFNEDGLDNLVIHFKNWLENLNDENRKKYQRRRLINDGDADNANMWTGIHIRSVDDDYFVQRNSTMRFKVRHQFYQGSPESELNVYSEGKGAFLKGMTIMGGVLQLMGLSSSFYLITAMMSTLELAIHLPIMNYKFPSNVMTHLRSMTPIVMFDVIENLELYVWIFDSKADGVKGVTNIRPQVEDLTYDKHNPWLNLGTVAFLLFVNFIRVGIVALIWPCRYKNSKIASYYHHEKSDLFWGDFLFIFVESMLEILFSAVLFFYVPA